MSRYFMNKIIFIFSMILLGGCTTQTTYSSHMYGNNQDTITTGKHNQQTSSGGMPLYINTDK